MRLTYNKKINNLNRTLDLHIFEWGVIAVVKDKTDANGNVCFKARNFRITTKYPTIADNEVRALKFFKMEDAKLLS